MSHLAIEIGFYNVRAAFRENSGAAVVPLGLDDAPYYFPPIGIDTPSGHLLGQAAKMSALAYPGKIEFLSDFIHPDMVGRELFTSFLRMVCQRVEAVFHAQVKHISFILPFRQTRSRLTAEFLSESIREAGRIYAPIQDPLGIMIGGMTNGAPGEKVLSIDLRDFPGRISVVSRNSRGFETIGSLDVEEFSIIECENFILDRIVEQSGVDIDRFDDLTAAWVREEMLAVYTRHALQMLSEGRDVIIDIPFAGKSVSLDFDSFKSFVRTGAEYLMKKTFHFLEDVKARPADISHVILMGQIFQSDQLCQNISESLQSHGCAPRIHLLSQPKEEWAPAFAALKLHHNNNRYAL